MLTERQREVLVLIARGLSNFEIAEKLIITKHTVKAHICAIYEILKVNCRVQAVIVAIKSNIISLEEI